MQNINRRGLALQRLMIMLPSDVQSTIGSHLRIFILVVQSGATKIHKVQQVHDLATNPAPVATTLFNKWCKHNSSPIAIEKSPDATNQQLGGNKIALQDLRRAYYNKQNDSMQRYRMGMQQFEKRLH